MLHWPAMRHVLMALLLLACSPEQPPSGDDGAEYPKIQPIWQMQFRDGTLVVREKGQPEAERNGLSGTIQLRVKSLRGGRLEGDFEAKGAIAVKGSVSGLVLPKEQGFVGQLNGPELALSFRRQDAQLILTQQDEKGRRQLFATAKIQRLAKAPSPR